MKELYELEFGQLKNIVLIIYTSEFYSYPINLVLDVKEKQHEVLYFAFLKTGLLKICHLSPLLACMHTKEVIQNAV